ncbi:MAG TPA: ABC transporter permease subunit [Streptosporangiaceae bacterium]|nr:ABC transporter permease subunit [Streptosporangiaceae bacterium]
MTSGSITRDRPGANHPAARNAGAAFRQVVRAEWIKFASVRGWVIGMIVAALLILLFGVFLAGNASIGCGPTLSGAACLPKIPIGPGGEAVTDSFYFARQPLSGNGSLTVRVTSLTTMIAAGGGQASPVGQGPRNPLANMRKGVEPWAKAGIIIAASTRQGSAYAAIMVTASYGVRMQYNYVHDTAGLPGRVSPAAPRWLRLTRNGNVISGYDSADGKHWLLVGTASLAGLPGTVQAGPFATSPIYNKVQPFFGGASIQSGPSQATAVMDDITRNGRWPAASWTGDDIGGRGNTPGTGVGYFRQSGGTMSISGSGDIAPVVPGPGSFYPTTSIEQPLMTIFIGLIAVVVVAAMFFTAEYRRGLIRITLAATPNRACVLAAKAVVAASAAFVAALVASVIAVSLGVSRMHAEGQFVLPVSTLTEVRVLVGTAAMVAVTAVLAVAVGAIMRRSAAAVTTAIVVIVLPFLLSVAVLPANAANWVLRLTPAAGFAVEQSIPNYPQVTSIVSPAGGTYPLSPWAGFGVLCLWVAAALVLATVLLRRRDA